MSHGDDRGRLFRRFRGAGDRSRLRRVPHPLSSRDRSVRRKRNQGARAGRHPFVLFLDSDCEASPTLLSAYAQFIAQEPFERDGVVAAGPTRFRGGETLLRG